ncbi:hypothetical protein BO79DRAFT_277446 [Aspergillus costaricaensis CBS 115574]|uniref:Uncharacterized protein n=1 Tax=Aspergillus costaricaensis CBS 115574 TaxID=1448317 RepID=A0ACD1HZN6_9EURO|nr:hypothetical protein BO79DRAFT_277446 [Aspergillus costaricaensis CBS 115574]RAK83662.1 hypothetical protein BO79DRAFT_277446 [Aspergillus costaricaensis CBS 115574]
MMRWSPSKKDSGLALPPPPHHHHHHHHLIIHPSRFLWISDDTVCFFLSPLSG